MLTDTALRNLKPKEKPYKVSDRDGMAAGSSIVIFTGLSSGTAETFSLGIGAGSHP